MTKELDDEFERLEVKTVHTALLRDGLPRFGFNTARGSGNTLMQLTAKPRIYVCGSRAMVVYARGLCLKHKIAEPRFMVAESWDEFDNLTRGVVGVVDVDHHARDVFTVRHQGWMAGQYKAHQVKRAAAKKAEEELKQKKEKVN